jgi:hypothetical protein
VEQLTYLLFLKMADEKGIDLSKIQAANCAPAPGTSDDPDNGATTGCPIALGTQRPAHAKGQAPADATGNTVAGQGSQGR